MACLLVAGVACRSILVPVLMVLVTVAARDALDCVIEK